MTVGTGIGGSKEAADSLAHAIVFSLDYSNPDKVIFFGSKLSKNTIDSVKKQYQEKYDEEFDFYEFVQIEEIDSFSAYFNAFKYKITELDEYRIIIDYTSGTKTMTMSAAFASMLFRKNLYFVSGERKEGVVIKGTEKIVSQNLYPIYDDLMLLKIKESFNYNRFEAGKALLEDITRTNKDIYEKLFNAYYYFDNVDYKKAKEYFDKKGFEKEWPELKNEFGANAKALHFLNDKDSELKYYYSLASLLNNARRRAEEMKYDDAIARLYRSLELIAQIQLKLNYNIDASNVDLEILKNYGIDYLSDEEEPVKISLNQDYILLNELNDSLGKFYMDNKEKVLQSLHTRNNSVLAHGLNSQVEKDYNKFRDLVMRFAKILNPKINFFIDETMFPEFSI